MAKIILVGIHKTHFGGGSLSHISDSPGTASRQGSVLKLSEEGKGTWRPAARLEHRKTCNNKKPKPASIASGVFFP